MNMVFASSSRIFGLMYVAPAPEFSFFIALLPAPALASVRFHTLRF